MTRRGWLTVLLTSGAARANWPQFRGEGSRGVAQDDPRLPESWSRTENVAWRTPLPGMAWSGPIVWGDRVFLTNCVASGQVEAVKKGLYFGGNRPDPPKDVHRWSVLAFNLASGKRLWEQTAHDGLPATSRHLKNSFASETPATDGERVYAHFGHLGTFCYDLDGKLIWSKRWPPRPTRYGWGTAASPVLHQGRLYIVNDNDEASSLTALEAATGKEIWRIARDEESNWATPFVWEHDGRTEIVTPGTNKVRSYDLDGKALWELGGMSSIVIPTPFTAHGLLYVTSGYVGDETRPVFVIRPGAKGDISLKAGETSNEAIAWSLPQGGPYNPSPLVYGDLYYTLYDRGFLTCHDARTGEEIYGKQRLDRETQAFTASPWAYNGKVFCMSEDGDCFVIAAGEQFSLLGKNSLGEMTMATPAIAAGGLVIRTAAAVYRIETV
jgi:outer membrane protein assembly factor BamB